MWIRSPMYNNLSDEIKPAEPEYDGILSASLRQNENATTGTPKTPEIIQNLMSITSPLDEYVVKQAGRFPTGGDEKAKAFSSCSEYTSMDTCSSTSGSNVDSPTSPTCVQNMCSQLIKEGLKLTLQQKRKKQQQQQQQLTNKVSDIVQKETSGVQIPNATTTAYCNSKYDESSMDTEEDDGNSSSYGDANSSVTGLTAEDEERRKRRRERNKIAATRCRLKKRERTFSLVHLSESLESQNQELKLQIQKLENQRSDLKGMLTMHKPICLNPSPEQTPACDYQQLEPFIPLNKNLIYNPTATMSSVINNNSNENYKPTPVDSSVLAQNDDLYNFADTLEKNSSVVVPDVDISAICKNTYLGENHFNYELLPGYRPMDESLCDDYTDINTSSRYIV